MTCWNKCLASKKLGGLGIGSIFALNAGLLFKWIWRFMQNSNDLWASVIKAIHGHNGGIHADSRHSSNQGTWCGILSMVNSLKSKGNDLLSLCTRKLGNRSSIRFWDDGWCGNHPLKVLFPHVYLLDIDKGCQNLIKDVVLSDCCDTWSWSPDSSKGFTVASVRHMIDARFLDLPSGMNLDKKGIDVDSILCPVCNDDVETVNHLFFSCDMAKDLWSWRDDLDLDLDLMKIFFIPSPDLGFAESRKFVIAVCMDLGGNVVLRTNATEFFTRDLWMLVYDGEVWFMSLTLDLIIRKLAMKLLEVNCVV
ncbi:RNA-directed DNA polymerase, eukaryota, reverse transcriptase zinc-binding domain protein [Tanacetum coccineum]